MLCCAGLLAHRAFESSLGKAGNHLRDLPHLQRDLCCTSIFITMVASIPRQVLLGPRNRTEERNHSNIFCRMCSGKYKRWACHDVADVDVSYAPLVPGDGQSQLTKTRAFGIMLGYIAGVIFRNVLQGDSKTCLPDASRERLLSVQCSLNWRLMLASPMLLPLIAAAYVFTLPESPRWLLLKARQGKTAYYEKAFRSLCKLRHSRLQAARDLFLMHHLLDGEEKIKQNRNRFVELWTVDRNRRALVASLTVMFLQQICGVNVMAFYSSEILSPVLGDKAGLLASMGFGILNFLFALPAVYTIDTFGRRNLLLCTYPFLAFFQLLTAMGFLLPDRSHSQTGLVLTGMYLFSIFYSPGQGPVPFVYSAESMPLYVRDLGMSMATATLWFFNFLLAVTFPRFQYSFGNTGAFGYYAAWCVVGWFMILFLVPETKNLTLEQLDARFSIPTRTHARWAVKEVTFVIQYHLLKRKGATRPVLKLPTENEAEMNTRRLPPRKLSMEIEQREISETEA